MSNTSLVAPPAFTGDVSTDVQLEPLQGGDRPEAWLNEFPSAIYNQSENSLLYQFLFTLLGPTGVGYLRDSLLQARLVTEEGNMTTSQIEDFYGNPFGLTRSVDEFPQENTEGLMTQSQLATIEAQNARYQNRAIDFLQGVGFGNSPRGLKLVAKSGLGQDCEVIEQYEYLYDQKSDHPIGLPNYGHTSSTEELVIVANNEISDTPVQTITINSGPTLSATLSSTAITGAPGTYYWQIVAIDAGGNSSLPSNEVKMTVSADSVHLWWQPVQSAVSYKVYRSTSSGGEATPGATNLIVSTTNTDYVDTIAAGSTGNTFSHTFQLYFNGNYIPQETGVANAWIPSSSIAFSFNPKYVVAATATTNVNISSPGTSTFNGTTVSAGQVVRLIVQTNASQNGYYVFNGSASAMTLAPAIFADQFVVQSQLQALAGVGAHVTVSGGPSIVSGSVVLEPYVLIFSNVLPNQSLNLIQVTGSSYMSSVFTVVSSIGSISGQEILGISPIDLHGLQTSFDRIKPVTMVPTTHTFTSVWNRQPWQTIYSTTQRTPVVRYTTGRSDINWPATDSLHWIVGGIEAEAPRQESDTQHDYRAFHQITQVTSSTNQVGPYNEVTQSLYPNLTVPTLQYQFDPSSIVGSSLDNNYLTKVATDPNTGKPMGLMDGSYPYDYVTLVGIDPSPKQTWWSSAELTTGTESLIIDLGTQQAVNYLEFETTYKPYNVQIEYDIANQPGSMSYYPVSADPSYNFNNTIMAQFNLSVPWQTLSFYFTNGVDPVIFTRYIKLIFTRGMAPTSYGEFGWSIDIRNLRVGRVVG
jgi:hypothetical protein